MTRKMVYRRGHWVRIKTAEKTRTEEWVLFCKRTEDPKLAWIERELDALGIPHRRNGKSWHAPILEVAKDREAEAESILTRKVGRYTVDDIRDDHPRWKQQ